VGIKNRYDQVVFITTANQLGVSECESHGAAFAIFTFGITLALEAGQHALRVGINQPTGNNKGIQLDSTGWFSPFRVDWNYETQTAPFLGMFGLPASGQLSLQNL
jgi:lipopolysaccharide transport system ATP-binding protein